MEQERGLDQTCVRLFLEELMLNIRESPGLQSFKRNLRKLDLSVILNNNDNCCNLCST